MTARELRTSKERVLFRLSVAASLIAWIVIVVSVVGLAYGLLVTAAVLAAHALLLARVTGNGVRVTSGQLPDIWNKVQEASRKLGLDHAPEVYVVQAGGILNAFATKLLSRRFVIIYSNLLDACDAGGNEPGRPSELDFVIGHELGHLAAGHLAWQWFLLPSRLIPLLGAAYSRAREYTCDPCGHAVVNDLEVSSRALTILAAGGRAGRRVNLNLFVEQVAETGRFWMAVSELNASHPYLSKRVAALRVAAGLEAPPAASRSVLAYPLAPVLGLAGGGPMLVVVIVTYAIILTGTPALKKYFAHTAGRSAAVFDPAADQPGAEPSPRAP